MCVCVIRENPFIITGKVVMSNEAVMDILPSTWVPRPIADFRAKCQIFHKLVQLLIERQGVEWRMYRLFPFILNVRGT